MATPLTSDESLLTVPGSPALTRGRRRVLWFLLVFLPFLAVSARQWAFGPGLATDDYAQYLMHADALAHGRAYGDIAYIYTPYASQIGPALEPPGWPMTLAPVLRVFGRNLVILRLLTLGLALTFIVIAGRYFARREPDEWTGAGAALLCGLALHQSYALSSFGADMGFCALVWLVILLADRAPRWSWGQVTLITLVGVFAVLYRTAGIALIPAMGLYAVVRRKEQGVRPLVPLAAWVGVAFVTYFVLKIGLDLDTAVPRALTGTVGATGQGHDLSQLDHLLRLVKDAGLRALRYRRSVFQSHLYPFTSEGVNTGYHILTVGLMALGLVAWFKRTRFSFLAGFAAVYVFLLLLTRVQAGRYLFPLYPLLAFGALAGLQAMVARFTAQGRPGRAGAIALAATLGIAGLVVVRQARLPEPPTLLAQPDVRTVVERLKQIEHTQPIRAVFVKPRVLAWHTGIPSMGLFAAPPEKILAELRAKRITHVVLGDLELRKEGNEAFVGLIGQHPELFTLEYRNGTFSLYALRDSAGPPGDQRAPM